MNKTPLLSKQEALDQMLASAGPVREVEIVSTLEADGRVLAQDQISQLNVPPKDNTQMDGYALRASDCVGTAMPVSQRIPAGYVGQPLAAGTVARIFTGAMIPEGADAVVMQEQCQVDSESGHVQVLHTPVAGEWIRRAGEDIALGSTILQAGAKLRPQELGLAASVGLAQLPVFRKLRVAVFFTGDELTMPGEPLKPGAIYNSNRFTLRGLLQMLGCEITDLGNVPDTLEATRQALRSAAHGHDLILTSGGVSVGEEDHIRPAVEAEGRINMWQIAIKPGKPLAFGEINREPSGEGSAATETSYFIGLPGNPVSSFVNFLLFVRPFIHKLQGQRLSPPQSYPMRADFNWPKPDRRNEFLRVRRNQAHGLDLFAHQGSGVLTSTVWGDGLIDNPAGQAIAVGDTVHFIPFSELLS
jgi:molybdopterin molybdotransferase